MHSANNFINLQSALCRNILVAFIMCNKLYFMPVSIRNTKNLYTKCVHKKAVFTDQ